jgi:PAS domain S-box-containing protein
MSDERHAQIEGDILVVDDDLPSRQALSTLLADHGYEVRSAPDGPTALMIVAADPPDLIVLDVLMFEMDGYEVCRRLKTRPESCDIPVLFVSALGEMVDRVKGFEAGGVDFITKPFQAEEVLARVATHLALRSAQKQLEAQNAELRKLSQAVEQSANVVIITDPEGRIEYANPRFEATTGYTIAEALGQNPRILKSGAHSDAYYQELWKTITSGQTWQGELYNKRKDGSLYWEQATITPVCDESGQITSYIAVKEDVTERKQANEALRRRADELDVLNRIALVVATLTDLPQALAAVAEIVTSQFAATLSAITMWRSGQNEILAWFSRDHGPEDMVGQFLPMATAPNIRDPLYQGQAISFPNILAVPWPDGLENLFRTRNVHAMLVAPLRVRGTAFGVLAVMTDKAGRTFSPDEISLAETIATDVAAAIENTRSYEQAQELAVTRERQRLARDLHDSVTQTLYSVTLTAEALPRVWAKHPDQAQAALNNLHRLARGALGEMRTLLFELQPAMLLEKEPEELLRQLAHATMGRTQTTVEVGVQGERALPDEVRVALYRIAQEALNNVTKHADASQVIVELDLEPEQVVLDIKDDGRGFDPETVPQLGFGVRNMADRANEIGAAFSLQSHPGQGTQIQVVWPEHPPEHPGSV